MVENNKVTINVSDFQKVFAVMAVMMQTILSFALVHTTNPTSLAFIGAFYVAVKYTAPIFIFGIVYNMVKTSQHLSYIAFLKEKLVELVVPYVLWTLSYLLIFPSVQQRVGYTDTSSFLLKIVTGDGAPHLWYTIMMLQIQLLMPFFIWLGYKVFSKKATTVLVLILSTLVYIAWYMFYQKQVFLGAHHDSWYLLDRFVVSFLIYGIYGAAAFRYHAYLYQWLNKIKYGLIPAVLLVLMVAIKQLLASPGKISFNHAPYLNTVQSVYSLLIIMAVFWFASMMILKNAKSLVIFKWLSTFAYRTYLANVFIFQLLLLFFKDTWLKLPLGIMILVAYLMTVSCAFFVTFSIHSVWQRIKGIFSK